MADAGIVRTQAMTIVRATPHRTAERPPRRDPTPMIAPVIVWVVETGIPPSEAPMRVDGARELRARAADRLERRDPHPHRPDDPPAAGERSEADRGVAHEDDPERDVQRLEVPRREEEDGDDPHRLLRVVHPVAEREGGGRDELDLPEPPCRAARAAPSGRSTSTARKKQKPRTRPSIGDRTMKTSVLHEARADEARRGPPSRWPRPRSRR